MVNFPRTSDKFIERKEILLIKIGHALGHPVPSWVGQNSTEWLEAMCRLVTVGDVTITDYTLDFSIQRVDLEIIRDIHYVVDNLVY